MPNVGLMSERIFIQFRFYVANVSVTHDLTYPKPVLIDIIT